MLIKNAHLLFQATYLSGSVVIVPLKSIKRVIVNFTNISMLIPDVFRAGGNWTTWKLTWVKREVTTVYLEATWSSATLWEPNMWASTLAWPPTCLARSSAEKHLSSLDVSCLKHELCFTGGWDVLLRPDVPQLAWSSTFMHFVQIKTAKKHPGQINVADLPWVL